MIFVMEFKEWHINGFDNQERLKDLSPKYSESIAYTIFKHRHPIAIAGVYLFWKGVGEAWTYYDKSLSTDLKHVYALTRTVLDMIIKEHQLHRVQATCIDDVVKMTFLRRLGFKREALLEKYNEDGSNAWMYSMIKDHK